MLTGNIINRISLARIVSYNVLLWRKTINHQQKVLTLAVYQKIVYFNVNKTEAISDGGSFLKSLC